MSLDHLQPHDDDDATPHHPTHHPTTTPTPTVTTTSSDIHPRSSAHLNQLAEARRVALQAKLGTELEQLTRQYAERVETQKILDDESSSRRATATTPPSSLSLPAQQHHLPEPHTQQLSKLRSDYFEEQIMLVEPSRDLENAKANRQGVVTDMLLRILLISHEAVHAQLGWDDAKMNKVARQRLRQVLDFQEPDPLSSGVVHDLAQCVSIQQPLHVTIDYFNKMEYNHGEGKPDTNPLFAKIAAYFAVKHGTTEHLPRTYPMEFKTTNPMEMDITDILTIACKELKASLKKRIRAREKKFIKRGVLLGSDLYNMCWVKDIETNVLGTVVHDESNGHPNIDVLVNENDIFHMKEPDAWRILAVIGVRHPDIVKLDQLKNKAMARTEDDLIQESEEQAIAAAENHERLMDALAEEGYHDPADVKGNKQRYDKKRQEQLIEHREVVKEQRRLAKKAKKKAAKALKAQEKAARKANGEDVSSDEDEQGQKKKKKQKPSPKKMSRRKKLRLLAAANAAERDRLKKKEEAEFHAAHENSEGMAFKKKAYRPSKAAIMLNDQNYYNDARLSTRRPGSRNSVFEPDLENTAYGRAKIAKGEMKRRGTEYIFRPPKGHLKGLAKFNLTLVRPPTKEQKKMLRDQRRRRASTTTAAAAHQGRYKRPRSTEYSPIHLYKKAQDIESKQKRLKQQRFGSLRNLDRAVAKSKQMLHEIQAIPTTAPSLQYVPQTSPMKYQSSPKLRTLSDLQAMNSDTMDTMDTMETLPMGTLTEMEGTVPPVPLHGLATFGVAGFENGPKIESDEQREQREQEEQEEQENADQEPMVYDDEGTPLYLAEDGEYYYGEEEYDDYDDSDDETLQQLKDLQRQYDQKLKDNALGKSGNGLAKVPVLPSGFINGQLKMTRKAQIHYVTQDVAMKKLDKRAHALSKKLKKKLEDDIEKQKKNKPKPPKLLQMFLTLTNRYKKKKQAPTQAELMAQLKGGNGKEKTKPKVGGGVAGVGEEFKDVKEVPEGGTGGTGDNGGQEGDNKETTTTTSLEDGGVETTTTEDSTTDKKLDETNTKGVETVANEDEDLDSDWEEEKQDDTDPFQDEQDRLAKAEKDRIAKETLKNFTRYVELCKNRYKVVLGEVPTHATNFKDMYSEWRVRNVEHRKYHGWDDPPPDAIPRKRLRPLNYHVQRRVDREERRRNEGLNVMANGVVLTDRELFELKRAQRLANAPKSMLRKIYEFFI